MEEKAKIMEMVQEMAEIYGRKMSDGAAKRWAELWAPYDSQRLQLALDKVCKTCQYMPTVAVLREAVSHLYPSQLAQDVAEEWAIRHKGLGGVPSQEQIDEILAAWGIDSGAVQRKDLTAR